MSRFKSGFNRIILIGALLATSSADAATRKQRHSRDEAKKALTDKTPKGPLLIVVSISDQRVSLFGDTGLVARSAVSTGMSGLPRVALARLTRRGLETEGALPRAMEVQCHRRVT